MSDPAARSLTPAGPRFEECLESRLLGNHRQMRQVRALILRFAASNLPVLVVGESGTGKNIVLSALHEGSPRNARPLQVVTAGELGNTAWSVLFGHRKGAFSSAHEHHVGLFEVARGSTLVLEDVVDFPPGIQPILLRAIEQGVFRPLGAHEEVYSDVRVLAATNRPLDTEVSQGRFRIDFYERLAVLKIVIPPLRAHLEDLRVYVPHFLRLAARQGMPPKSLSDGAMNLLFEHTWPRNVRELEHLIYRAVLEVPGDDIGPEDVRRLLLPESALIGHSAKDEIRQVDSGIVLATLKAHRGNKSAAARKLRISRGQLYKLLRKAETHALENSI